MPAQATTLSLSPLGQGFLLCASMIIAFGPQNLFILRQGLRKQHLFVTALFSTLADVVLVALGVGGLSALINANSHVQMLTTAGGVLFLAASGSRSLLYGCRRGQPAVLAANPAVLGIQTTIIAALGFSFLNPAAYLDTIMIIGSKSLLFPFDQRIIFGIGAVSASAFWFFALTYGASRFAPLFRTRAAWRALDVVSGCLMLGIAVSMLGAQLAGQ
jgi:L-lysine exporter family protein LysE/ArgO